MNLVWIKVSVQCASYGKVISHLHKISIVGKFFSFSKSSVADMLLSSFVKIWESFSPFWYCSGREELWKVLRNICRGPTVNAIEARDSLSNSSQFEGAVWLCVFLWLTFGKILFFLNLGEQNFFSTSISKTGLGLAKDLRPCEWAMFGDLSLINT